MGVSPWLTFFRTWVVTVSTFTIILELARESPQPKRIIWGFGCLTVVAIDLLLTKLIP
jgi:hypothetical protein